MSIFDLFGVYMGICRVTPYYTDMMLYLTIPLLECFWLIIHSVLKVRVHYTPNYTYLTYSDIFDTSRYTHMCDICT